MIEGILEFFQMITDILNHGTQSIKDTADAIDSVTFENTIFHQYACFF